SSRSAASARRSDWLDSSAMEWSSASGIGPVSGERDSRWAAWSRRLDQGDGAASSGAKAPSFAAFDAALKGRSSTFLTLDAALKRRSSTVLDAEVASDADAISDANVDFDPAVEERPFMAASAAEEEWALAPAVFCRTSLRMRCTIRSG